MICAARSEIVLMPPVSTMLEVAASPARHDLEDQAKDAVDHSNVCPPPCATSVLADFTGKERP